MGFVDALARGSAEHVVVGAYDFGASSSRIGHAVDRIGAKRLSIDTLEAIFNRFADSSSVRTQLFGGGRGQQHGSHVRDHRGARSRP